MCKLTVIIPVYNESEYIAFAIESVLNQRTSFPFVLLIVDDASDDDTPHIIEQYREYIEQEKRTTGCVQIINIRQKRNRGKGYCMYRAYNEMKRYQQGGYFLILDGDDFFTIRDKLQRQVVFLEENPQYFGCGHEYIVAREKERLSLYIAGEYATHPKYNAELAQRGFHNIEEYEEIYYYAHTSTMMYRNMFSDIDVPAYFGRPSMRGDSALLLWYFIMTQQRVGHMNMLGSCYNIHGKGIWSGIKVEEKKDLIHKMMRQLTSLTSSTRYKEGLHGLENLFIRAIVQEEESVSNPETIYQLIYGITQSILEMIIQEKQTNILYLSQTLDTMLENIGKVYAVKQGIRKYGTQYKKERVGILCSESDEEEYTRIICNHIDVLVNSGKEVYVFYVSQGGGDNKNSSKCKEFCTQRGIPFFLYTGEQEESGLYSDIIERRLCYYLEAIYAQRLSELHCYILPFDIIASCCMQEGIAECIILHTSDVGSLAQGISMSVVDAIYVDSVGLAHALCRVDVLSSKSILVQDDTCTGYTLFHGYNSDIEMSTLEDEAVEVVNVIF